MEDYLHEKSFNIYNIVNKENKSELGDIEEIKESALKEEEDDENENDVRNNIQEIMKKYVSGSIKKESIHEYEQKRYWH